MADSTCLKPFLVFVGSGAGGLLRYWLGGLIQAWWGPTFPLGTLIVNITGCLAIGFFATFWAGPVLIREEYRAGVLIGLIGGYTTFSAFGRETVALADDGQWWRAGGYIAASIVLGLLAVWIGGAIATRVSGAGGP